LHANGRAGADVIAEIVARKDSLHAEFGEQIAVEFFRFFELTDGQNDMCHAVDVDHLCLYPCAESRLDRSGKYNIKQRM